MADRAWGRNGAGATAEADARPRRFSALRNRNFALLWSGSVISNSGSWMQIVAQGWLVYDLTGSPVYLGVTGMARAVPMMLLPPMGGVIADRVPRLKLLKVTQIVSLLLALLLAVLVSSDVIQIWQIVLLSFLSGAVHAFDQPSRQALLPDLVRPADMTNAIALNSAAWQGAALFGPTLAGATIAVFSLSVAFYANAASYLAVIAAIAAIRTPGGPRRPAGKAAALGTLAVAREPRIRAVLLPAVGLAVLALPYAAFLPAMARDVFRAGPGGLSALLTATGAGAFAGAVLSGLPLVARHPGRALAALQLAAGLALAGFAWAPGLSVALGAIALFGAALIGYLATANATIQLASPPGAEGRALGLWMIVNSGLVPLGSLGIGAASALLGVRAALGLAGLGCALCGLGAAYVARRGVAAR